MSLPSRTVLATQVRIHDVEDAEGFVAATIERSGIQLSREEHEELLAEGITILYQLAQSFEPRRGDHQQDGRFSGYAAQFLPRKLGDAWHRWNPDHRYVTGEDGKREWRYYPKAVSIDGLRAGNYGNATEQVDSDRGDGPDTWEGKVRAPAAWAAPEPSTSHS